MKNKSTRVFGGLACFCRVHKQFLWAAMGLLRCNTFDKHKQTASTRANIHVLHAYVHTCSCCWCCCCCSFCKVEPNTSGRAVPTFQRCTPLLPTSPTFLANALPYMLPLHNTRNGDTGSVQCTASQQLLEVSPVLRVKKQAAQRSALRCALPARPRGEVENSRVSQR